MQVSIIEPADLALILLGSPLVVGLLLGVALRRLRGRAAPSIVTTIAVLVTVPVAAAVIGTTIRLGIWDGALIGLLGAVGMIGGLWAWQDHPIEVLFALASLALTLAAAEWLVRTILPHPPGFPAIEGAKLFLPRVDLDNPEPAHGDFSEFHRQAIDGCSMLYPERYPAYVAERTKRDGKAQGSVVYLGDSMTYGLGVRLEDAFPAMLEQITPALFHFNLGFPGTSVDYHYVIARRWIPLIQPPVKLVVVGLYFNDVLEIDQGMSCCQNHSVVTFESGAPVERCPTPSWTPGYGKSISWFLRNSPPPYPLRVAMGFSHMARYAGAILYRSASETVGSDRPNDEVAVWDQMGKILAALQAELAARNIPLVAVMMPIRSALETPDPATHASYKAENRTKELAKSLGIHTLDPWGHFRPLVERDGSSRYFIGDDDIHLSAEGHVEMANWLAENASEIRAAASAANPDSN